MEEKFYNRELMDEKLEAIHQRFNHQDFTLEKILEQTTKTNGKILKVETRVDKVNRVLLIIGCVTGTLLITNGSEFISFLIKII